MAQNVRTQPGRPGKRPRTSIDRNEVSILANHVIRAAGEHLTWAQFQQSTSITGSPNRRMTGRHHGDRIALVGKLIDATFAAGVDDHLIQEKLWQYIQSDTGLRAQFSALPAQQNPPPSPGRVRNAARWARLHRTRNRHRYRIARPGEKKTKLTRSEAASAAALTNFLRREIPKARHPRRLGTPESQYLYHIPGQYLTTTNAQNKIERLASSNQLYEASRADPSRVNDWLAFEDETANNDNTDVWKVLTRAQLIVQKADALEGLPLQIFHRWNNDVHQLYP